MSSRTLRPHPSLMRYYALTALLAGPAFPILLAVLAFRYRSLSYELDEEGITMRWGILFRREVSLTFARIQDIHLTSNVVERWLGLARIQVQTASGSAAAEMTIEGLRDFEAMRDFLYARMRGVRHDAAAGGTEPVPLAEGSTTSAAATVTPHERAADSLASADELATLLRSIADEVRALRLERARESGGQ